MRTRVVAVLAAALLAAFAARLAIEDGGFEGLPDGAPTQAEMAADLGSAIMREVVRGHVPGRSGEVMFVAKPHVFVIGPWDLTTLAGDPDPRSTHPAPWNHISRIPLVLYGPGIVPKKTDPSPVDLTALAPTYARLLDIPTDSMRGRPLLERPAIAPRAIVTVVVDGAGTNVLREHAASWPHLRSMSRQGTVFSNARVGSTPAATGALHANVGTGVYPTRHGITGNIMRVDNGRITDAFLENADGRHLRTPTVSELWDEANENSAVIAEIAFENAHMGMIGRGAQRKGGDRDVAALWAGPTQRWWINEEHFRLPDGLRETRLEPLATYEDELDNHDGEVDGAWFSTPLEDLRDDPELRPRSPAFARFTGDAVVDVLRSESIGKDQVCDLVWIEFKMPDGAGHQWNMVSDEVADVVASVDEQLDRIRNELDAVVGRGKYLLAVTADHGQEPLPDDFGGWRINEAELHKDLVANFGDIVQDVTTTDVYFKLGALESGEVDLETIARYLATYTVEDNIPRDATGAHLVPQEKLDDTLFAAAFSTEYLQALDAEEIASLGAGIYPEGQR